jgi:hypothetical protein
LRRLEKTFFKKMSFLALKKSFFSKNGLKILFFSEKVLF